MGCECVDYIHLAQGGLQWLAFMSNELLDSVKTENSLIRSLSAFQGRL